MKLAVEEFALASARSAILFKLLLRVTFYRNWRIVLPVPASVIYPKKGGPILQTTARVAVDGALYHFDREYTYLVPQAMAPTLRPGCRVRITFGTGNLTRQGMVLQLVEEELPTSHRVKSIRAAGQHLFSTRKA